MHKIVIAVTATRTGTDNQFKGTITFTNERNDEVIFEYLSTNPKEPELNLEFSGNGEKFEIKGLPSKELIEKLKDNQKWIFGLSIGILSDTLENSDSMLLSHETTQLMRMFKADASGKMSTTVEVGDDGYQFVFGKIDVTA